MRILLAYTAPLALMLMVLNGTLSKQIESGREIIDGYTERTSYRSSGPTIRDLQEEANAISAYEKEHYAPYRTEPTCQNMGMAETSILSQYAWWMNEQYGYDEIAVWSNLNRFLSTIIDIESNGDRHAVNSSSGAAGRLQFKQISIPTALNRLSRWYAEHSTYDVPLWATCLRNDYGLIHHPAIDDMSLAFANLWGQSGTKELIHDVATGRGNAGLALYCAFHHTNPDKKTINRAVMLFAQNYPTEQIDSSVCVGKQTLLASISSQ